MLVHHLSSKKGKREGDEDECVNQSMPGKPPNIGPKLPQLRPRIRLK